MRLFRSQHRRQQHIPLSGNHCWDPRAETRSGFSSCPSCSRLSSGLQNTQGITRQRICSAYSCVRQRILGPQASPARSDRSYDRFLATEQAGIERAEARLCCATPSCDWSTFGSARGWGCGRSRSRGGHGSGLRSRGFVPDRGDREDAVEDHRDSDQATCEHAGSKRPSEGTLNERSVIEPVPSSLSDRPVTENLQAGAADAENQRSPALPSVSCFR